jgi:hypothetical protein
MSDTYEPVSPAGVEDKPAAVVPVHDSEKVLREMPPQDAREIFGEEITAEWSPEQAVEELRKQRSLQNSQPNRTVRFDRDGRRTEQQTDKAAAADLSFSRRVEHANRLMEALPGIGPERAVATASEALTGGHIHEFKLDDATRADALSHGDTPEQAQRRLSAMREERAAALHALTEQLSTPVEQQQPAEAPPVETQQQPPEQPPPPADPLEPERQRVQQEAATLAALRNMSAKEIQLTVKAEQIAGEAHRLNAFITQKHGAKVQQAGGLEALGKIDPGAVNEILQAQAAYNQGMGQAGAFIAESQHYQQLRQTNEALLQNTRAAELARVNRVEGEKAATEFTKYVEARDPQWKSDPDYRQSLQKMAADIVEEVAPGSAAAIQRGEMYVTTGQQKALYDVARARLNDERIKQSMETGRQKAMDSLPRVLRPGNGETRAEAAAHDQSAQLDRLSYMSPTDAAKAGARLLAARRSAARNAR